MKLKNQNYYNYIFGAVSLLAASFNIYANLHGPKGAFYSAIIIFVIMIAYLVQTRRVYKKAFRKKMEICSFNLHLMNHYLRDEFYALSQLEKNDSLSEDTLIKNLSDTCEKLVVLLSDTLTALTENDVCIHIKHFPPEENKKIKKPDGILKTLCRCNRTMKSGSRHKIRSHKISENTHIENLLHKESFGHLYYPDFHKAIKTHNDQVKALQKGNNNNYHLKEFKIKNSSWGKFYKSLILVPIQLEKNNNSYGVIGLLIADSKIKNTFKQEDKSIYTSLMKAFADGIYTYFDKVLLLQENLKTKNHD